MSPRNLETEMDEEKQEESKSKKRSMKRVIKSESGGSSEGKIKLSRDTSIDIPKLSGNVKIEKVSFNFTYSYI